MKTVSLIYTEDHDWVGLYIDGKLIDEGHELRLDDVIKALGFKCDNKEVSNDWIENKGGRFPEKEDDCKEGLQ